MKKSLTIRLIPALIIIGGCLFALPSCTTKKYYNEIYEGGLTIDPATYPVKKSDFTWNDNLFRWECSFDDNYLTEYQLEKMEIAGTVIFTENGNRYYSPMPYMESYYDGNYHVVETIGYEVTRGLVTFYIQTNEKDLTWYWMYDEYQFKVSLFMWQ